MTTHDHTPHVPHDHVEYATASMVSARVCNRCGAYVLGDPDNRELHQEFHDRIAALEATAPAPNPKSKKAKSKK